MVSKYAIEAFETVSKIREAKVLEDAYEPLFLQINNWGIRYFADVKWAYSDVGLAHDQQCVQSISDWPSFYAAHNYQDNDPILKAAFTSLDPVVWSDLKISKTGEQEVMSNARMFGHRDGVTLCCHDLKRNTTMLTFGSDDRLDKDPDFISALHLLGLVVHAKSRSFDDTPMIKPLTAREKEIMFWISEGKTDWEISMILTISKGTVTRHFQNIKQKWNVATRGQAAAQFISHPM